jgi:hypothetical protein
MFLGLPNDEIRNPLLIRDICQQPLLVFVIPGAAQRRSGIGLLPIRHGFATDEFAPSLALARWAACGVRVGYPANAVGFSHPRNACETRNDDHENHGRVDSP